jgi:hypothetical protein
MELKKMLCLHDIAFFFMKIFKIISFFSLLIAVSQPVFAQNTCDCVPRLYEGFDYATGGNMHNKVGGTGWAGAWDSQVGDPRVGFRVGANTLIYNALKSNYQSFVGGHYWHRIGRTLDSSPTGAFSDYLKPNGLIGKNGTTLWTSFLFQKTQNNDESVWAGLHDSNVDWFEGNPNSGNNRLLFGYFGAAKSMTNGVKYWTLQVKDSFYKTNVPIVAATPVFAAMKLVFTDTSSAIQLFINPPTLGSANPPTTPTLGISTSFPLEIKHFMVYGDANINNFILDEIRFSSTYRCVAPDTGVNENLLPKAIMSVSDTFGIAPFTLTLNGATSFDPDGTLAQYEWIFGDGGTKIGAITNYTFKHTGAFFARLKVTDNCGSFSAVTREVLATLPDSTISCLAAPVAETLANCNGTGGVIRMATGLGTNFTITHQNGTNYPFLNARFSNLPIGKYTIKVSGQKGCKETFQLQMPIDTAACAAIAPVGNALTFGMGLEGLAYWDKGRSFKDFMKTSDSQLLTHDVGFTGPWNTNVANEIPIDANGYPLAIPVMTSIGLQRVHFMLSAGGHLPIGNYVFLYEGIGIFHFRGQFTVLNSSAGRVEIQVNGTDNLYLEIETSTSGNHLRNFRLLRPTDESTYLSQPFNQDFLDKLCPFSPIRMMDWQVTNASTLENWNDRGKPTDRSQTMKNGVAYEHIIQLANVLNRDIWICVPHKASDDFIFQMATLFKNGLNPNINVFLEYSNEVWNWSFEQAHWVSNNGNNNISYPRRYVDKALNSFRIWQQVWGTEAPRIRRVLATQTGWTWISEEILAQAKGEFDYFAPAFYFGYNGNATCLNNLRALGANATATDVLHCTRQSMRDFFPNIRQTYRLAQMYGKPIAHYEGGQHITSNPTIEPFQAAIYQLQIDPQIATLYQEMIDSLRRYGSTRFATAYTLTGPRESRYGSWGHLENNDQNLAMQPAPKYQALLNNFTAVQPQCSINSTVYPKLKAKVFLNHLDVNSLKMSDYISSLPNFPLSDPYANAPLNNNFIHVNNTTIATISPSILAVTGDNAIIDWVFLELRQGVSGASTVVQTAAALLQSDGDIVATDGISSPNFINIPYGNYYITVRHRNHLGFRTLTTHKLTNNTATLDFTNNSVPLHGVSPIYLKNTNLAVMNGGDANADGSIDASDSGIWELQNGSFDDYQLHTDYNLDGSVDALDSAIWELNNGKYQELD